MLKYRSIIISFLVIVILGACTAGLLSKSFPYPYPQAKISSLTRYAVLDMTGIVTGFRRLISDVAWIQLLVYYGSCEDSIDKEKEYKVSWDVVKFFLGMKIEHDNSSHYECAHCQEGEQSHSYSQLYDYCRRVVQLDPFFTYAYLYGAGALAWNQDRTHQAVELLESGIKNLEGFEQDITQDIHQPYWQLHLYMSAIIYRKSGDFDKMIHTLQVAAGQKSCPNIVRAILANIYQKKKKYAPCLKLWIDIYDTGDPSYTVTSEKKITKLRKTLGL